MNLQYIADSSDPMRRQRGRRGMEVLAELQKEPAIPVRISDIDVEGVREVDDKLVVLARQMRCPILTNDLQSQPHCRAAGRHHIEYQRTGQCGKICAAAG